jgi:hypothetical protein
VIEVLPTAAFIPCCSTFAAMNRVKVLDRRSNAQGGEMNSVLNFGLKQTGQAPG